MNRKNLRTTVFLFSLLFILTIGGVSASWLYAEALLPPASSPVGMTMEIFEYAPEEILPGEGEDGEGTGTVTPGENHLGLLGLVLNEATNFGLNLGDKSVIHANLQNRTVVFCNQNASGKNLKHLLNDDDNTFGLYFCVEKVTDTVYNLYSFSVNALPDMGGTMGEIEVYKTVIEKTDIWRGTVSYLGHAEVKSLSAMGVQVLNEKNTSKYSIDPATWHNTHKD